MKSKPIVLTTFFVLSVWTYFFTFTGNAISEEGAVKIYHFRAKVDMLAISRNLQVEEEKPGGLVIEELKDSDDSTLAMIMSPSGKVMYIPDALGSTNIQVIVNKNVGYTTLAGLKFYSNCTINIWKDGTVEVNKEGIMAKDDKGVEYVSCLTKMLS